MAVTGVIPSSKPEESTLWSNGNVLSNLNLPWPPPPPPPPLSLIWWAGEKEADVLMTEKSKTEWFWLAQQTGAT